MAEHQYVSVSFPKQRKRATAEQALRIELELKKQELKLSHFISESRLSMTSILQGGTQPADAISEELSALQNLYLPEGWHDSDLTCDIEQGLKDLPQVGEIWDVEDFRDHLRALFWCIDLEDLEGDEGWQRISDGLEELVVSSTEGVKHSVKGDWVIAVACPDDEPYGAEDGLWRRVHRIAALPERVREWIGIGLSDESREIVSPNDSFAAKGQDWFW